MRHVKRSGHPLPTLLRRSEQPRLVTKGSISYGLHWRLNLRWYCRRCRHSPYYEGTVYGVDVVFTKGEEVLDPGSFINVPSWSWQVSSMFLLINGVFLFSFTFFVHTGIFTLTFARLEKHNGFSVYINVFAPESLSFQYSIHFRQYSDFPSSFICYRRLKCRQIWFMRCESFE